MNLTELFCDVDDFCKQFIPYWHQQLLENGSLRRKRQTHLSTSEIMSIVIHFHHSRYREFKAYYKQYVAIHLRSAFPKLVSYERFVALIPRILVPLTAFLQTRYGSCTGISFIDSTSLTVCHNKRISQHKVLKGGAKRGKTSMGWFFGFKLHLVVNDCGDLLACQLTPGNVDDRKPVPYLAQELWGKLFGDKGYISQSLFEELWEQDVQLITRLRKNMKEKLMPLADRLLLRKRSIIETIIDQLKNISQIEHSRHRSPVNYFVNVIAGLIAYCYQPKKPSLNLGQDPFLAPVIHN